MNDLIIALALAITVPAVFKTIYHMTGDVHLLSSEEEWNDLL